MSATRQTIKKRGLKGGRDYLVSRILYSGATNVLKWSKDEIFEGQGYGQPTLTTTGTSVTAQQITATFVAPFMPFLDAFFLQGTPNQLGTGQVCPFKAHGTGWSTWANNNTNNDVSDIVTPWFMNEEESTFDANSNSGSLIFYCQAQAYFEDGVSAIEIELRWYPDQAYEIQKSYFNVV